MGKHEDALARATEARTRAAGGSANWPPKATAAYRMLHLTDEGGNASLLVQVSGAATGDQITATATDANGNTSEFSQCVTVTAPIVVGRILSGGGVDSALVRGATGDAGGGTLASADVATGPSDRGRGSF